jgi:hypothetical protein
VDRNGGDAVRESMGGAGLRLASSSTHGLPTRSTPASADSAAAVDNDDGGFGERNEGGEQRGE